MHGRQSIACELPGDVRQSVALAPRPLLGDVCRTRADAVEDAPGAIGDAAVELTRSVAIEGAAGRVWRVLRDVRQLERLRVVERRMPAAVVHDDGMFRRDSVEIVTIERTLILELRIVVKISLHPG